MGIHTATRWNRLNIGPRVLLGFAFIILSVLAADAVILWQFHVVRTQAEHLSDVDQKLVAVVRVHTTMLAFHDQLEARANAEDAAGLVREVGRLRAAILEDIRRATTALSLPPFNPQRDPTILPTLQVIQSALPSHLDAITTLASSGDWRAVHLRIANQVRPLESLTSALVEKVDHDASEQHAETVRQIGDVQRGVYVVVPLSAVLTLAISATLGLAITRSITQPLARLVEGSKALARGEFQQQVSVTGSDELAHLGQVFNDTARRLRDLYATLQSSEDRLRLVIDTIPAYAWSARPDGSVDFVNRPFLEFAGCLRDDLLGWRWGSVVHPEDLARYVADWQAAVAAGEPMEVEARVRRTDGEYRWLLIRNVPLRDEPGNIVNWYGTAIDVTEWKRAQEALHELQANLARVSRVTTMGELTASLAHEIKQPIAAAATDASTCLRWLMRDQPDLAEARGAAARIIRDVNRAAEIISRIRSLFYKGPPQRESLDVNEIIEEMVVLLRNEASRYSITIGRRLADNLPRIIADHVQLQQVFMNLMLNGIEAMVDRQPPRELTVTSLRENGQILISVSDTGAGLSVGQADEIFNPFFTTKPHGTGMGLPISRSIIESHGGRLWVVDNSPRGARFYFTLPTNSEVNESPRRAASIQ
jgi:PAS domain S-box-containing protein